MCGVDIFANQIGIDRRKTQSIAQLAQSERAGIAERIGAKTAKPELTERDKSAAGKNRAVRNAELTPVVTRIAQIPTADIDRFGGRVEQFDPITRRARVGVRENFVDHDRTGLGHGERITRGGGAADMAARPPRRFFRPDAGMDTGVANRERKAFAVGKAVPAVVVLEAEDRAAEAVGQRDLLAAVLEPAGELAGNHVGSDIGVTHREGRFVPHDEHALARRQRRYPTSGKIEGDRLTQLHAPQVDRLRAGVL